VLSRSVTVTPLRPACPVNEPVPFASTNTVPEIGASTR
jgi:hypothetical protein